MNTNRNDTERERGGLPPALATDLEALREATGRDLPALERTRRLRAEHPERTVTAPVRWRWAVAGAFGGALVIVALLLPISYQRVVGADVHLTVRAEHIAPDAARSMAQEFGENLGASEVLVQPFLASGRLDLSAHSDQRRTGLVQATASLLADALADEGFQVRQETRPVKAVVKGRVADLVAEAIAGQALGLPPNLARELAREDTSVTVIVRRMEDALERDGIKDAVIERSEDGRHVVIRLARAKIRPLHGRELRDLLDRFGLDRDSAAIGRASLGDPARNDSLRRALTALFRGRGYDVMTGTTEDGKSVILLRSKPSPVTPGKGRPGK